MRIAYLFYLFLDFIIFLINLDASEEKNFFSKKKFRKYFILLENIKSTWKICKISFT